MVAALDHTAGVVLGQAQVALKSNDEIPALRTLSTRLTWRGAANECVALGSKSPADLNNHNPMNPTCDCQLASRASSCSTARRIQLETDRSSAAARFRISLRSSSGNHTGTGSLSLALRRTGGPSGTWLSGSA